MTTVAPPDPARSDTALDAVQFLHFAPDALDPLRRCLNTPGGRINPMMVLGRPYGAAVLVDAVVAYQDLIDHSPAPVPGGQDGLCTLAWWGGYRRAMAQWSAVRQVGWLVHTEGQRDEDLVPLPDDGRALQTLPMWQVGCDATHVEPAALLLLSTVAEGGRLLLRAWAFTAVGGHRELAVTGAVNWGDADTRVAGEAPP